MRSLYIKLQYHPRTKTKEIMYGRLIRSYIYPGHDPNAKKPIHITVKYNLACTKSTYENMPTVLPETGGILYNLRKPCSFWGFFAGGSTLSQDVSGEGFFSGIYRNPLLKNGFLSSWSLASWEVAIHPKPTTETTLRLGTNLQRN